MKKTKRILAGILGFAIIIGLLAVYDGGNGDPFSEAHARRQAVAYARKLYPEQDFTVKQVFYDSPFVYRVTVQSQQSQDTSFDVETRYWINTTDQFYEDGTTSHEWYVESGLNTRNRMGREAAKQAAFILQRELPELELTPVYGIDADTVEIDLCYSVETGDLAEYSEYLALDEAFQPSILNNIPTRFVAQVLWEGIPTEEDLQNVLGQIKTAMEENGMPMTYYNVTLYPKDYNDDDAAEANIIMESGTVASADI